MKYIYPAIFNPEGTQYNVTFPDLPGCLTCGDNLDDALAMAKDVLCLWLYTLEEDHKEIPIASNPAAITTQSNDFISVITVDTEDYRRYYENTLVKKTLNIPYRLNELAKAANINFSQLLQKAIKTELGLPLSD